MDERAFRIEFESFWTKDKARYVLLKPLKDPGNLAKFLVYDIVDKGIIVVEDDEMRVALVTKLKEVGVQELHSIPKNSS